MSRAVAGAATSIAVVNLFPSSLTTGTRAASLEYILQRVRLNLVPFNAQDVYQLCTMLYNADSMNIMNDAEFMRGIAAAFKRSDQRVLNPFQTTLVMDTLRRAGINAAPTEVLVPEEDAISPETLLNVLRSMTVQVGTRDERKIDQVLAKLPSVLDDFTPTQLSAMIKELATLQCTNVEAMNKLAKRLFPNIESLNVMEVVQTAKALAESRGMPYATVRRGFGFAEQRVADFEPEDYVALLSALQVAGKQYNRTFVKLVESALERVESLEAVTLSHFLVTFTMLEYSNREHVEIFADALVEVSSDLEQRQLVQSLIAMQRLNLLHEEIFGVLVTHLMRYVTVLEPRNIAPVMDICSGVSFNTDALMSRLLDRALECTHTLHPTDLADILDIVALYPGARGHALVDVFGRQARLRVEVFSPPALSCATRGLAHLGYRDPEYYMLAAETGFRFGFKDWAALEPILMGLCYSDDIPGRVVKVLASFIMPLARSMSVQEVERANRYLVQLRCEEDHVYRALAHRVMHFVKEITPDMPQELQTLVERGAVNRRGEG
ncbi:mitochondrial RNA binding complex 1 subunit [Novymonas esmeraldas]|uniref:Mitochondrial RNA binding complex 1 subunit n=1 Tax=Novymonas esmeraldas TaxID=1808958 RepID=A0AAW0F1T2_9TRYP